MNTLKLKKMGIDFWKDDKDVKDSDCGNYRLRLVEPIIDHNNTMIEGDFGKANKYLFIFKNGKKRKKPKLIHRLKLQTDLQTRGSDGLAFRYNKARKVVDSKDLTYTKKDILKLVNTISKHKYDQVEIIER